MRSEQEFIDQYCDGDPANYDPASIAEGRREVIKWDQIVTCSKMFPELEQAAYDQIRRHLGYLPDPSAYMNHEVFIRVLIDQFNRQQITEESFNSQVIEHVKHIRNDNVNQGGYIDNLGDYTSRDLDRYRNHFPQYKEKAKARLKQLMGYESEVKYSLYAELMIRELCAMDWYVNDMIPGAIDYRAITVIHYRKALMELGKEFADALPLMAV